MPVSFKKTFKVQAIETPIFRPGDHLAEFIIQALDSYKVPEKSILVVTSKLFSLVEGLMVKLDSEDKESLIKHESDQYIGKGVHDFHLTIKHGLLMPSAGIDQSNSPENDHLLLPRDPYKSLEDLWPVLREQWKLKQLGLLMTDSHTTPLRRGVTGVGLAHWGFKAVRDCRGELDLFDRELKVTTINNVDALSASAVWAMGEGADQCPLALIEGASLEWTDSSSHQEIQIPFKEDLYNILFEDKIAEGEEE